MKKFLLLIAILIQLRVEACSCDGPTKFIHSVGPYIMKVEVLDVIALDTLKGAYTCYTSKGKKVVERRV